jgi:hypothetical protein
VIQSSVDSADVDKTNDKGFPLPTAVFEGRELVVGAVPRKAYREVIEKLLPESKKHSSP